MGCACSKKDENPYLNDENPAHYPMADSENPANMKAWNLIFVCTSNVCRSPMAEFIAKDYIKRKNLQNVTVFSRGLTDNYSAWGSAAQTRGCAVMKELYNLDMTGHRSTLLSDSEMENADAIFVVTDDHIKWIGMTISSKVYAENEHKIRLTGANVPDPWFWTKEAYYDVARMLYEQVPNAMQSLFEGKPRITKPDDSFASKCYNT